MISILKVILFVSALSGSSYAASEDTSTSDSDVILSPPLKCEGKCELRIPDGECFVDVGCLLKDLEFPDGDDDDGGGGGDGEDGCVDSRECTEHGFKKVEGQTCRGKCVFTDKKDNCRLDLICLLDRNVEGTLRFLSRSNVDAETAILLALSAGSHKESSKGAADGAPGKSCNKYANPDLYGESCEIKKEEETCRSMEDCPALSGGKGPQGSNDLEQKEELPDDTIFNTISVVGAPYNECKGKCKVLDADGNCVTDYDCVRGEQ